MDMNTEACKTKYMRAAIKQGQLAAKKGEVPVGAVIVKDGTVIAKAHNLRESRKQPTAHAELLAIEKAAKKLGGWRLSGCTLYVTLEPCPMCAGAIINARLDQVVYGAVDSKAGYTGTLHDTLGDKRLNHQCRVESGVLAEECAQLLKVFFAGRRAEQKAKTDGVYALSGEKKGESL